jgi:hypothetical protein
MRTDEGFLLVATNLKPYHTAAQMLADSLKEFAPNHPVILFTEDKWVNDPGTIFLIRFTVECLLLIAQNY